MKKNEQRAPLAAFFVLAVASVGVFAHAIRTDAVGGLFVAPAQSVISGSRLIPLPSDLFADLGIARPASTQPDVPPAYAISDQVVTHMAAAESARQQLAGPTRGTGRPGDSVHSPVNAIEHSLTTVSGLTTQVVTGATSVTTQLINGVFGAVGTPSAGAPGPATPTGSPGSGRGTEAGAIVTKTPLSSPTSSTSSTPSPSVEPAREPRRSRHTDRPGGDRGPRAQASRPGAAAPSRPSRPAPSPPSSRQARPDRPERPARPERSRGPRIDRPGKPTTSGPATVRPDLPARPARGKGDHRRGR